MELLTICDMTFQYGHVLEGLMTHVALQVLLQHAFCMCYVDLQDAAFMQLVINIRYIDEKGCCKGVPMFLMLQCC